MNKADLIIEAQKITSYLISSPLGVQERNNYLNAMHQLDLKLTPYDKMLWASMLKNRWKMACIDAGLAIKDPGNMVRRKIFTMLAILEASPKYTKYFLSDRFSFLYYFKVAFVVFRSIIRAIVGIIIIKIVQIKCR